jgi:hypothetical protein
MSSRVIEEALSEPLTRSFELTNEFYDKIKFYVVYNGPPNTIYGDYSQFFINSESGIIKAMNVCGACIWRYIKNPSEKILCEAVRLNSYELDDMKDPPKSVVEIVLSERPHIYKKYEKMFNENDHQRLVKNNPFMVEYLNIIDRKIYEIAICMNPIVIKFIENQDLKLCELSISVLKYKIDNDITPSGTQSSSPWGHTMTNETKEIIDLSSNLFNAESLKLILHKCEKIKNMDTNSSPFKYKYSYYLPKYVSYLKFFNDKIVDTVMTINEILPSFHYVPEEYHTTDRIIKVIHSHPECFKNIKNPSKELCQLAFSLDKNNIEYIHFDNQTEDMTQHITNNYMGELYKYGKFITENDYLNLFNKNPHYIDFIPKHYQTVCMCELAVSKNIYLLEYCEHITPQMIYFIRNSQPTVPRKNRFDFIKKYDENVLMKIISCDPHLLSILPDTKQTDMVIKAALNKSGYNIQYVINKTDEYKKIALENEPKCIKYLS